MFARLNVVTVAIALALPMVFASPTPALEARSGETCNTGSQQCCNKYTTGGAFNAGPIAGLLGIVAPVTELVGFGCTGVEVLAMTGNSCSQQTVCCTGNQFNGLVNVGCTPVKL